MIDEFLYVFRRNLHAKLKTKIMGRIFLRVVEGDELFVRISRRDGTDFRMYISNLTERVMQGWSTDDAMYEIIKEYRKYVLKQYFK